jgi:hypothetical protein
VLAAFGLASVVPVRLPGGQGTTWRAGQVVLKPADSARAGRWFADVYDALTGPGFRVPRPDLAGNVLFADGMPPAVMDFSPLERPAESPLAIAAVDALQWHQARPEVLDQLADEPELDQLLARALIYRQITEIVRRAGTAIIDTAARTGQPVTDLILARLAR